jgi:hypothetical protein
VYQKVKHLRFNDTEELAAVLEQLLAEEHKITTVI